MQIFSSAIKYLKDFFGSDDQQEIAKSPTANSTPSGFVSTTPKPIKASVAPKETISRAVPATEVYPGPRVETAKLAKANVPYKVVPVTQSAKLANTRQPNEQERIALQTKPKETATQKAVKVVTAFPREAFKTAKAVRDFAMPSQEELKKEFEKGSKQSPYSALTTYGIVNKMADGRYNMVDPLAVGSLENVGNKIIKNIAKSKDVKNIARNLLKIGINDEGLATKLTKTTDERTVDRLIKETITDVNSKKPVSVSVDELQTANNAFRGKIEDAKPGAIERAKEELQAGKSKPVRIRTLEDGSIFIEDGRHRIEAAKQLGIKKIPVEDVTNFYNKDIQGKYSNIDLGGKKAFNINLDELNLSPVARNQTRQAIETIKPELESIKGARLTEQEVLKDIANSSALNKVITRDETLAFEQQLTKTRSRLKQISEQLPKVKDKEASFRLREEQARLFKIVSSEAADKGRKLQAFKNDANAFEKDYITQITEKLAKLGHDSEEIAKKLNEVDPANAEEINKVFRQFEKPKFWEIIDEFRYNNALSNPRTFERNLGSNILQTIVTRPLTQAVTDVITGHPIGAITGLARYYGGAVSSIGKGMKEFSDVFAGRTGIGQQDLKNIPTYRLPKAFRLPTLALEGTDRLLSKIIEGGVIAEKMGKGVAKEVAVKDAKKIAEKFLFRSGLDEHNKTGQGHLLSAIDRATAGIDAMRKKVPGASWFLMFLRTPMNFAKTWLEYSPAGILTLPGNTHKAEQIAKTLIGSAVTAYGAQLAMEDRTTWGIPTDPELRDLFYAEKKQPYSVKIGNSWVPMMYFGPAGLAMALPAAFKYYQEDSKTAHTDEQWEKGLRALYGAFEFFTQQTFMENLGNFVTAINSDENKLRELEKVGAFASTQIIPWSGMVRYISTIVDPIYRKADGFLEAIERDIPYMSKNLDSYKDPVGAESQRDRRNLFTPWDITKNKDEYDQLYEYRQEQLQINNLLKQDTDAIKKRALTLMEDFQKAKTQEDADKIGKELAENKALRNTFVNMVKKQAMYIQSTIAPIYYFKDSPSDIADIIYGRFLMAKTQEEAQEKVADFIVQLRDAGLYNEKVGSALKALVEKSNEADNIEEAQQEAEQQTDAQDSIENQFGL